MELVSSYFPPIRVTRRGTQEKHNLGPIILKRNIKDDNLDNSVSFLRAAYNNHRGIRPLIQALKREWDQEDDEEYFYQG